MMRFLIACVCLLGLAFSVGARAEQFDINRYDIYYGDINGDGYSDVYFHGTQQVVLIHGDVVVPIIFPAPPSFAAMFRPSTCSVIDPMCTNWPGTREYVGVDRLSDAELSLLSKFERGFDYHVADFNGDGNDDVWVLASTFVNDGGFILSGSSDGVPPSLVADLRSADVKWLSDGFNPRASNMLVTDVNGDGRADIVFLGDAQTADIAYLTTSSYSYQTTQILAEPTTLPATLVGSTQGSLRINETGATTYSIPIATPAGTAGVKPQIALNYNSQGRNGLVGQGWSLSGLSSITRCRQTVTQDRNPRPVTWTSEDRFCLDGQRLMVVEGTYGQPGSVYRTEIESFAKVTAHGGSAGNPDGFLVEKKDGSRSWYGNGANAKEIAHNGKTFAWGRNEFKDSVGNAIKYTYAADVQNGFRVQEILYAFGPSKDDDASAKARVIFSYENRPDPIQGYFAGYSIGIAKRLSRIEVRDNNKVVRSYHLRYLRQAPQASSADYTSRLAHIQECVANECLPATEFAWSLLPSSPSFATSTGQFSLPHGADKTRHGVWKAADINGDGYLDLVIERYHIGSEHVYYYLDYRLSTNKGTTITNSPVSSSTWNIPLGERKVGSDREPFKWSVIDYNNDGRADIVTWHQNVSYFNVYLSQPNASGDWRIAQSPIVVAQGVDPDEHHAFIDINGDGLLDAVSPTAYWPLERDSSQTITSSTPYRFGSKVSLAWTGIVPALAHPNAGYTWYPEPEERELKKIHRAFGDFNGDGVTDVIGTDISVNYRYQRPTYVEDQRQEITYLLIRNGNNLENHMRIRSPSGHDVKQDDLIKSPDLNGDGLSDLFFKAGGVHYYQINNGAGFNAVQTFSTDGNNPRDFQFIDYNNDGRTDVAYMSGTGSHYVALSTGSGFGGNYQYMDSSTTENEEFNLVDISNDGRLDLLHLKGLVGGLQPSVNQAKPDNVITRFTNGLGRSTTVEYEALNHSDHYRQVGEYCDAGFPCDNKVNESELRRRLLQPNELAGSAQSLGLLAPIIEIHGPLYIATQLTGDSPAAGTAPGAIDGNAKSSIEYYYGEAYAQAGGRGPLGFKEFVSRDNQTGLLVKNTYRVDFPFIGRLLASETRTNTGDLLAKVDNTWELQGWQSNWPSQVAGGGSKAIAPLQLNVGNTTEHTYPTTTNLSSPGSLTVGSTAQRTSSIDHQYDGHGNLTRIVETITGSGRTFITDTVNHYGETPYEREKGRLSRSEVTHTRTVNGVTASNVRTSEFTYYHNSGSAACYSGPIDLDGLLCEEIIEPDKPEYRLTTTHFYDGMGNKLEIQQSDGEQTRRTRSEYDPDGRYVDRTYNGLGHLVEEVVRRNDLGQPAQTNGLNGVVTHTDYDVIGRITRASDNTGASEETSYLSCRDTGCPTSAAYLVEQRTAGGSRSRIYVDKLGRTVREGELSFNGQWSYVDTEYDKLNRVKFRSEPFFVSQGPQYWVGSEYDVLGRPIRFTLPDGSTSETAYSGLSVTVTNGLGQRKTEIRNANFDLVEVVDHDGTRVRYEYDALGNLEFVKTDNRSELTISNTYDLLGRKLTSDDPDKGFWQYTYNRFGQLETQTDAKAQTIVNQYDVLGRLVERTDYHSYNPSQPASNVEHHTRWYYDDVDDQGALVPNALGEITAVVQSTDINHQACSSNSTEYCERYQYDGYGRAEYTHIQIGSAGNLGSYSTRVAYDNNGRISHEYDVIHNRVRDASSNTFRPSGIRNTYNNHGYLEAITDLTDGDEIYRALATDARGNIISERLANNATSQYGYDPQTGNLTSQTANLSGVFAIQDISYTWDVVGNLGSRRNNSTNPWTNQRQDRRESFCYDNLNRLIKDAPNNLTYDCSSLTLAQQDMRYDAMGNITYKAGVGDYVYDQANAGPHAVTSTADGVSYYYDDNGNMTSDTSGRAMLYTVFDKAHQIAKGNHQIDFKYGPSRGRYQRTDTNTVSGDTTTTLYLGSIERVSKSTAPGEVEWKRYLPGGAMYTVTTTENENNELVEESTSKTVIYRDHLGSVDVITDSMGSVVDAMSFDSWGQRRDPWTWEDFDPITLMTYGQALQASMGPNAITIGFTGHEMLDEVGLIHMNGRIYDPRLGRFIQADPYVDGPNTTQGYNRYSYAINNPLNMIDPTGYYVEVASWVIEILEFIWVSIISTAIDVIWQDIQSGYNWSSTIETVADSVGFSANSINSGNGSSAWGEGEPHDLDNVSEARRAELEAYYQVLWQQNGYIHDRDLQTARKTIQATDSSETGGKYANGAKTQTFIESQAPSHEPGETETGATGIDKGALLVDLALEVIPGGALYKCGRDGCDALDWVGATVDLIPGIGKVGKLVKLRKFFGRKKKILGCSFIAGTLIATSGGALAIEELQVGDLVMSKNEITGEIAERRVNAVFVEDHSSVTSLVVRDEMDQDEVIITTDEHPFYVADYGWVAAGNLVVGDMLESLDGMELKLVGNETVYDPQPAYNFEVDEFHTYSVGESNAWVHNACDVPKKEVNAAREAAKEQFRKESAELETKIIRSGRDGTGKVVGVGTTKRKGPTYRPKGDGSYSVGRPGKVKHFRPDGQGGYTVDKR